MKRVQRAQENREVLAPHSIEAEQAVLGGLMLAPERIVDVAEWLRESDFYRRDHQLIYRGIAWLQGKGRACDAVTLGDFFEKHNLSQLVGGARYVVELANATPGTANIVAYAEIVLEHSRRRTLMDIGHRLQEQALKGGAGSARELVAIAQQDLATLGTETTDLGLRPVRALMKEWFAKLQERYENETPMTGIPTPWTDLNDVMLGLQDMDLILIAGNPSMGKSIAGFQIGHCAAEHFRQTQSPKRVAVFSLEMSGSAIVGRTVAQLGRIMHAHIRSGRLDDDEWPRVTTAIGSLRDLPMLIDEQASLTVEQIVARARREHMRAPLGLILIDHLHLIERPGEAEAQEIGKISRALKVLAKDLNIPVVALAQLNRQNTQRVNKKPTMADLRGSGSLEQDADVIILMHRDDYYDEDANPGLVEMIIGKGRDLQRKTIRLRNRFRQMAIDDASVIDEQGWADGTASRRSTPRGFDSHADRAAGD